MHDRGADGQQSLSLSLSLSFTLCILTSLFSHHPLFIFNHPHNLSSHMQMTTTMIQRKAPLQSVKVCMAKWNSIRWSLMGNRCQSFPVTVMAPGVCAVYRVIIPSLTSLCTVTLGAWHALFIPEFPFQRRCRFRSRASNSRPVTLLLQKTLTSGVSCCKSCDLIAWLTLCCGKIDVDVSAAHLYAHFLTVTFAL